MSVSEWSDQIIVADLQDEPLLSDDLSGLIERIRSTDSPPGVVLNFADVSYLNSSNLAQLIDLHKALEGHAIGLCVCDLQAALQSLFEITGLEKVFQIQANTALALAALHLVDGDDPELAD